MEIEEIKMKIGKQKVKERVREIVVQWVEKSFTNQKVASSIPCRSVLEQDTEPLIAPDVQCAISVNVKYKMCIHCKSHICKSLWIKASAKYVNVNVSKTHSLMTWS